MEVVLQTPIPLIGRPNIIRWAATSDGRATVHSAYHVIHSNSTDVVDINGSSLQHLWPTIWKSKLWLKVQAFVWRLGTNSIATKENLVKRGVPTSSLCSICTQTESREHLVLGCSWVHQVWLDLLSLNVAGEQEPLD